MIWVRPIQTHCVEVFWMPVSPSRPSLGLRGGHEGPWTKIFIFVTVKNFQWMCVPIFFSVHYWPKSVPFVHFKQNQSRGFWEKFTFLYTQFWPKTALFWSRGADFDPKTQNTACVFEFWVLGQKLLAFQLFQLFQRFQLFLVFFCFFSFSEFGQIEK